MDLLGKGFKNPSVRGGRGDFSWESVQNDAQRSKYLGNSLMVKEKRGYNSTRDVMWYTKDGKQEKSSIDEERRRIKEMEEEMIAQSLGLPIPVRQKEGRPTAEELEAVHSSREQSSSRDRQRDRGGDLSRSQSERTDTGGSRRERRRSRSRERYRRHSRSPSSRHSRHRPRSRERRSDYERPRYREVDRDRDYEHRRRDDKYRDRDRDRREHGERSERRRRDRHEPHDHTGHEET